MMTSDPTTGLGSLSLLQFAEQCWAVGPDLMEQFIYSGGKFQKY